MESERVVWRPVFCREAPGPFVRLHVQGGGSVPVMCNVRHVRAIVNRGMKKYFSGFSACLFSPGPYLTVMSNRLTSTRLEMRLTPDDEAVIDVLRRRAGYPTPSKADIIRAALNLAVMFGGSNTTENVDRPQAIT